MVLSAIEGWNCLELDFGGGHFCSGKAIVCVFIVSAGAHNLSD